MAKRTSTEEHLTVPMHADDHCAPLSTHAPPPSPARATPAISTHAAAHLADYSARAAAAETPRNTTRALRADSRKFTAWCQQHGRCALPATGDTVAAFITAMGKTCQPATISRYRSSIATLHRAARLPDPTKDEAVRLAMAGVNRRQGVRQRQAEPLNWAALEQAVAVIQANDTLDLRALRDVAVARVAYDALLRRSELADARWAHLDHHDDGSALLFLPRRKTDQDGHGTYCYLAPDTVALLDHWAQAAGIDKTGALFRRINRHGRVSGPDAPLGESSVNQALKRAATLAKLGARGASVSGHSCRVGAAQDMTAAGLSMPEIMQAGGWKSEHMPARYAERLVARRGGMAKLAEKQGRLKK